jgi:hypothetical protein
MEAPVRSGRDLNARHCFGLNQSFEAEHLHPSFAVIVFLTLSLSGGPGSVLFCAKLLPLRCNLIGISRSHGLPRKNSITLVTLPYCMVRCRRGLYGFCFSTLVKKSSDIRRYLLGSRSILLHEIYVSTYGLFLPRSIGYIFDLNISRFRSSLTLSKSNRPSTSTPSSTN